MAVGWRGMAGARGGGQPVWDAGMRSRGMATAAGLALPRSWGPRWGDSGHAPVAPGDSQAGGQPVTSHGGTAGDKPWGDSQPAGDREQDGGGCFFQPLSLSRGPFFCCVKSKPSSGLKRPRRCRREGEREREGGGQRKSHREQGCLGRAQSCVTGCCGFSSWHSSLKTCPPPSPAPPLGGCCLIAPRSPLLHPGSAWKV